MEFFRIGPLVPFIKELYAQADPFPHIMLDHVLRTGEFLAKEARGALDGILVEAYKYDNILERKRAEDRLERLPLGIAGALREMNSPAFLRFLEELTGIPGLIPDPYYRGGGLHMIPPGGKLDVHIDYNVHPILKLARRLNVLVYLNPEDVGGHLELWTGEKTSPNQHELDECVVDIAPLLGRMVIFSTSERSYHGHPEPTTDWRLSLSAYYYTARDAVLHAEQPHSTVFVKRPTDSDDPAADALRAARAQRRLSNEVAVVGRKD